MPASCALIRLCLRLSCILALSACVVAPRSGPQGSAVRDAALREDAPYRLVALNVDSVTAAARDMAVRRAERAEAERFAALAPVHGQMLRVGDVVEITIWEAVEGGLFSSGGEGGSRATTLPPQRIDAAGRIRAPYAGSLRAAGRTPAQLSDALVAALAGKAIEPQAISVVRESPGAAVSVVGDAAAQPGRAKLYGVGERLLDVIAAAGGVKTPAHQARVALVREGRAQTAWFDEVLADPTRNVAMRAGDTVILTEKRRSFDAFGAVRRPERMDFPKSRLSLAEGLSLAGGLNDERAEPGWVYLFRHALAGGEDSPPLPTVYQLDLAEPEAFLLAGRFELADGDVLYAANSPVTDLRKLLSLVGEALNPASRTVTLSGVY